MTTPQLDDAAVVAAYARWARVYDPVFGAITGSAIRATMREVNKVPAGRVLEVGVGTGLSLPLYRSHHRLVGIDLSPDMLRHAEQRVAARGLRNVEALVEMDAANLAFPDGSFDVAVAMFVMTVVPDAPRVLSETLRVVKPGGRIVIVNHFSAASGPRAVAERWLSRFATSLGWHPEFDKEQLLSRRGMQLQFQRNLGPLGLFTLMVFARAD